MNSLALLFLSVTLLACNAYRSPPESEVLYTKQDLAKRGFVLGPIANLDRKDASTTADLSAFDTILANTLRETWQTANLVSTTEIVALLDGDQVEAWRKELAEEDQRLPSPSTLLVLKRISKLGKTYPSQVLLPSLLTNSVSCGHKAAQPTYLSPHPKAGKTYCQRILKMRFRIMSLDGDELLWNGIIYATQETTAPMTAVDDEKDDPVEPPSTQSLVRECFNNFAKQFTDK